MSVRKALITGITGQDGSYLAELLLDKGYEVHGLIRRAAIEDSNNRISRIQHIYNKLYIHNGMIESYPAVINAVIDSAPDECYHLAAQSDVAYSFRDGFSTMLMNVWGTYNILEALRRFAPACKLYFAASSEMFGQVKEMPQNEDTPFYPRSPYGISKVTGFNLVRNYRESYGMFACSGILFNHACVDPSTPLLVKHNGVLKTLMIKEIRKYRENGSNEQWDMLNDNYEIYDGKKWVKITYLSAFKKDKYNGNLVNKIYNTCSGIVNVTNNHNLFDIFGNKGRAESFLLKDELLHTTMPDSTNIAAITIEEAELMGMMVADGWCDVLGRGGFYKIDRVILDRFSYLWKKITLGTIKLDVQIGEYVKLTRLTLCGNSGYLKYLAECIYTKYDKFKKVPDIVLNSSKAVMLSFLYGYNNCDGLKGGDCKYKFKNFKTNSPVLALGLMYLMAQTTEQIPNVTFEEDEKYYGYYFINWLSNRYIGKEEIAKKKLKEGLPIRRKEIKKIIQHNVQPDFVYNIETESGQLMAGVGTIVIGNSPRRGFEFVTRKISNAVANIKFGVQKELRLGNIEAKRDWGHSRDYVKAQWLMLQQEIPDDFVIATGETHIVKEFLEGAFGYVGLRWQDYVVIDPKFYRPAEVNILLGDATKAKRVLGWIPETKFNDLVIEMTKADVDLV